MRFGEPKDGVRQVFVEPDEARATMTIFSDVNTAKRNRGDSLSVTDHRLESHLRLSTPSKIRVRSGYLPMVLETYLEYAWRTVEDIDNIFDGQADQPPIRKVVEQAQSRYDLGQKAIELAAQIIPIIANDINSVWMHADMQSLI